MDLPLGAKLTCLQKPYFNQSGMSNWEYMKQRMYFFVAWGGGGGGIRVTAKLLMNGIRFAKWWIQSSHWSLVSTLSHPAKYLTLVTWHCHSVYLHAALQSSRCCLYAKLGTRVCVFPVPTSLDFSWCLKIVHLNLPCTRESVAIYTGA